MPAASFTGILDCGFYAFYFADAQHSLIVDIDLMIPFKIISDTTIAHLRILCMYLFNLICNPLVLCFVSRYVSVKPFVVYCPIDLAQLAKRCYWITVILVLFFDCLIDFFVSDQAQPLLLSISSSFFKKDASISARCFSARKILFSARSFSTSDISSCGFVFPRLSRRASTPPASYFTV